MTQVRIILYDWDDTLFPTTYGGIDFNKLTVKDIERLRRSITDFLTFFHNMGYYQYIVTNASLGWIKECFDKIKITAFLKEIKIEYFSTLTSKNNKIKKAKVYNDILKYFINNSDNIENIISITDSESDRKDFITTIKSLDIKPYKHIKVPNFLKCDELCYILEYIYKNIRAVTLDDIIVTLDYTNTPVKAK